jgi:hypothetical protein
MVIASHSVEIVVESVFKSVVEIVRKVFIVRDVIENVAKWVVESVVNSFIIWAVIGIVVLSNWVVAIKS